MALRRVGFRTTIRTTASVVSSTWGVLQDQAKPRLDTVLKQIDDPKNPAKAAADDARKTAATTAPLGSIALLVGAFIASTAAALGSAQRDEDRTSSVHTLNPTSSKWKNRPIRHPGGFACLQQNGGASHDLSVSAGTSV